MNTPRPTPAPTEPDAHAQAAEDANAQAAEPTPPKKPRLEPTRYGDWELNGKCVDF